MNLSAARFARGRYLRKLVPLMGIALLALSCAPAPAGNSTGGNGSTTQSGPKTLRMAMRSLTNSPAPTAAGCSPVFTTASTFRSPPGI